MIYIIIGSIGSGKTTVAKLLASKLNYKFVELDHLALLKAGYSSVSEATKNSPTKLKESELAVSKELSVQDDLVIVFGGSAIFNQLNFDYFDENNKAKKVVYLTVDHKNQLERILSKHPELKSDETKVANNLLKMNKERDLLCELIADVKITTDTSTPDEVVENILKA